MICTVLVSIDFSGTYLLLVVVEVVLRNLQVQGSRALANATANVVVATVARAEPAVVVTGLTDGHTTQVSADTNHDEPLRALDTVRIRLGVAETADIHALSLLDLIRRAVTHEDGLTTPLDDSVFTFRDIAHVDLDLGKRKDIARSAHGRQEVGNGRTSAGRGQSTEAPNQEVGERTVSLRRLGAVLAEVRRLESTGRGREATNRGIVGTSDLG